MSALPNGNLPYRATSDHALVISTPANATNSAQPSSLHNASSETELRTALSALHDRESNITSRLDALVASQADFSRDLGRLDLLRAGLGAQVIAVRSIGNDMLSTAAETAGRLSDRVRELDLEKSRVEQTLRVVEQVMELKACVNGVVGSMGAPQDWEAAASYLSRASQIPEDIIRGPFASAIVPSVEVPDAPWVTLENARESLCGLFLREFERAAGEGDGSKVTRFFKLFPLIGRTEVGLDVYGRYVCQGVAGTARATLRDGSAGGAVQNRREGFFYANALTKLFEHIAQIVEGHGELVQRHYGPGKMVRVIERLQVEADVQGGIVLDSWSDERAVDRKLTDVKSYPFSFLVQSYTLQPRSGTPRVNSPGAAAVRSSEDEGVNMKEVDGLLSEIAVMLGRWSLYTKFLAGKCRSADSPDEAPLVAPEVLLKSNLYRKVSAKLTSPYNVMTSFFFRRSVEKAFQLDEYPSGLSLSVNAHLDGNAPYIILAIDDVMYIVNNVIQKSISTSQREVIASVIPNVQRILTGDFIGMLQRKMKDETYPRPLVQNGFPPEDRIIQFIVLINSLDVSNDYLTRIISGRVGVPSERMNGVIPGDSPLKESFPFERDVSFVATALQTLESSFISKSTALLDEGIQVLFHQVVKARLRPILTETFRDADYTFTEDEVADIAQQNDQDEEDFLEQVSRRFEQGWNMLMKPIARLMTPSTYSTLLDLTARYLSKVLERRILGGRMNAFGGIRIERDFTSIVNTVSRGDYGVRELFGRVMQLLMVANMENDEWDEVLALDGEDGIEWVLTEDERRKARNLMQV